MEFIDELCYCSITPRTPAMHWALDYPLIISVFWLLYYKTKLVKPFARPLQSNQEIHQQQLRNKSFAELFTKLQTIFTHVLCMCVYVCVCVCVCARMCVCVCLCLCRVFIILLEMGAEGGGRRYVIVLGFFV
jgi:hypothetical protein